VTTFGFTTIPLTDPPAPTWNPTEFETVAEMLSAIGRYQSSLTQDSKYADMASVAQDFSLPGAPNELASGIVTAWPTTPSWWADAPESLQIYLMSIARAERSLYLNQPQPTGNATLNTSVHIVPVSSIMSELEQFENSISAQSNYSSNAAIAATATGLDNIGPSRDPLTLAKTLQEDPEQTWFTQMPPGLQSYVRDLVISEQSILAKATDTATPSTTSPAATSANPPDSTATVSAATKALRVSGILALATLVFIVGFL
jgi:hypothetical protein